MRILFFSITLSLVSTVFGQSPENGTFNLSGKIMGRDTGVVVLYYANDKNKNDIVSTILKEGKFKFSGKVNRVCDAYLWTDTSNHDFSDSSVIRFLLEPKNIVILYNKSHAFIMGSKTQFEKENFEKQKEALIIQENQMIKKYDSHDEFIKAMDLQYIRSHKNSYLSGFLLSAYKRRLPIDTLQVYYSLLGADVKNSSEGYKVLSYLYPLTDDVHFRNKNPIFGLEYNKSLNELKSVYNINLNDTSGNQVDFNTFRGKYLLIDFWTSWCGPCIESFPYMEKLIDEYKSNSIEFISVSLDTDNERWKTAIKKYNLPGIQLSDLKGFNGLLPVYCKVVTSIPRYVLINRDGKIINYDTPQPMNPQLKILIDNLIKKNS